MDTDQVVDRAYLLSLKHTIDHLEINLLAGVSMEQTLKELKEKYVEKGGKEDVRSDEQEYREYAQ